MNPKLLVLAVLIASSAVAADRMPPPGSSGFNWLDADSQCRKLTAKDIAKFSKCTVSTNAFGLEVKSHVCTVSPRVEYMVYETAAQCQELCR
ncbi:MAG: hypothetical protein ABI588_07020, partial [Arenimonas sp.]